MDNLAHNRLTAYQQYTTKLENAVRWLINIAIITSCTTLILFGYVVWRGL